jgi:endonuclease/exonuclease/phosphatase family metal-dependent hydrolase
VAVGALLISYLSVFVSPDKFWMPSFFGLAFPFILLANLLFIVFWIFVKPKNLVLSLLTILLGWGFVNRYVQFKGRNMGSDGIKVVSFNVANFAGNERTKLKENADNIIDYLKSKDADIICLQEIRLRQKNIFNVPQVMDDLKKIKHYQYASSSTTFGLITFTSYPIINMGEIRYKKSKNMAIYTDVVIGIDTVRIFNVHLQSNKINPRDYTIIDSPGVDQEKDLEEIRELGGKLKSAFQLRAQQVREIKEVIDSTPYPVIICGDFNDTPVSYTYQQLLGDFKDAFVESGKGLGRTYVGKLPSYRIDNILHSDVFDSYNFKADDFRVSDHLPVSCLLVKKQ